MKIGCILVLYNPDLNLLNEVIGSVEKQVEKICVIDNTTKPQYKTIDFDQSKINYVQLNKNIGIAAAQNIGIEYFIGLNFDYILFIDQDSILPNTLVENLLHSTLLLEINGYHVGVVCPLAVNRQDGKSYKEKYPVIEDIMLNYSTENLHFLKVNSCSSSGSFINLDNFRKVGLMDAGLFIDGVDNEWCWRAKAKADLDSFTATNFHIEHQFGEGDKSFLGSKVAITSPFRIYFQFRNYFIISRRDYVPRVWKIKNGFKYLFKIFYYLIFVPPRLKYLINILKGIKDGLFETCNLR